MNAEQKAMLERAKIEARRMGNDYVGSEHILLALLRSGKGKLAKALAIQGVYYFQVRDDTMILFGMKEQRGEELRITVTVETMLEQCELLQSDGESFEDCMGEVLLRHPSCVAMELLRRYDIHIDQLSKEKGDRQGIVSLDEQDALYCLNFQQRQSYVEREEQIELLVEILLRREKPNPLLVGEAGVGKSALVEALAQRIQNGEISALRDHYIYALDINTLVAGTRYRGDFEERIKKIIALFRSHPNAILFIDELHQMIGAGKSEGSIDVASVLKPCLARRELRCIGATTIDEYERYIEKDPALQRRFQCVLLKEPDQKETMHILQARAKDYSRFHQVEIGQDLLPKLVHLTDYYLPIGHFPDKALDVLDLSCAHARAHEKKQVDEQCVREVITSLSHIPFSAKQRFQQTMEVLQQSDMGWICGQMERAISQLGEEKGQEAMLGCWQINGDIRQSKQVLQVISEEFFQQKTYLSLDMQAYPFLLDPIIHKLHRCPYTILCIEHFSQAFDEMRSLLAGSLAQGELQDGKQSALLRHTLVVFLEEEGEYCKQNEELIQISFHLQRATQQLLS
ncbi:AAA family ATPase [Merdibacter massiliensis]|uniref:AAA family ATPase n=1 Tax=Merdibacter massiliensis TaxID=1871030 RepID=UPI00096A2C20|nr:AAA family ATPase [Merdibacter massiliensis]